MVPLLALLKESKKNVVLVNEGTAQLTEALRYKSECRGFSSHWFHWNFFIEV